MDFPDDLTDEQKIKIMADFKGKKAELQKQVELEKNAIPAWKIFAALPILFLIIWKLIPLPDPNYRNPTADELLAGLSGYHVAPGSDGLRPVVPLRERAFDPRKYEQKVARCKAKENGKGWFAKEKDVEVEIHYVDINPTAEKTLLLVHGWPAVWSSWRNQILEFESDCRLIIPTLRGFGNSTGPEDTESSTGLADFGNDLVCVLEDAGVEGGAVCVGHDWGSAICFDTAAEHPSKITALANSAVPYFPPGLFFYSPSQIASRFPTLSYQVYLTNDRHLAARELDARPKDLINGLLAEVGTHPHAPSNPLANKETILGVWGDSPIADQKLVSKVEEDYWVDAFKTSGFESTIAVYQVKNRKRSVDIASRRKTHVINIPTLYINPTEDALGNLRPTFGPMIENIPNLEIKDMATNHWPQLEKPEEYNEYLKEFLELL